MKIPRGGEHYGKATCVQKVQKTTDDFVLPQRKGKHHCGNRNELPTVHPEGGFMIIPVRHGTIMESEQYFVGDTWEKVKCSACNIVLDVDSADLECESLI